MKVIQLLSDLGHQATGIAKIKTSLLHHLQDCTVIDVTHNIRPFFLQQAAYLLASSITDNSNADCTIAVFDLYYTKSPVIVATEVNGQIIFAPDNGIIPLALGNPDIRGRKCLEVSADTNLTTVANSIANFLAEAEAKHFDNAGDAHELASVTLHTQPKIHEDHIECFVVHIDNFENVILNITKDEFERTAAGRDFTIHFIRNEKLDILSSKYNDVKAGSKLCRFNSAGYLEIAVRGGNAASLFGFKLVEERQKGYDTIKISFDDSKDSENDLFK